MDVQDNSTSFDYNDNNISFRERMTHFLANPNPTNLDKEAIYRELIATEECLQQISSSSWDTIPAMKDPLKIKAMVSP